MGKPRTLRRPPWSMISAHFPAVRRQQTSTPAALMAADQSGAWLRDRLDSLGIEVSDERDLYVVLAVTALSMEMADRAAGCGQMTCDERSGVYALGLAVTAALIDYVPGDVR